MQKQELRNYEEKYRNYINRNILDVANRVAEDEDQLNTKFKDIGNKFAFVPIKVKVIASS